MNHLFAVTDWLRITLGRFSALINDYWILQMPLVIFVFSLAYRIFRRYINP